MGEPGAYSLGRSEGRRATDASRFYLLHISKSGKRAVPAGASFGPLPLPCSLRVTSRVRLQKCAQDKVDARQKPVPCTSVRARSVFTHARVGRSDIASECCACDRSPQRRYGVDAAVSPGSGGVACRRVGRARWPGLGERCMSCTGAFSGQLREPLSASSKVASVSLQGNHVFGLRLHPSCLGSCRELVAVQPGPFV